MILASVSSSLTHNVRDHGLYAVFVLMAIDAVLPAASELVMVVGGAVAAGAFGASFSLFGNDLAHGFKSYLAVSIAGTLGYLVGAIVGWWIGFYGGRPLLDRYGRWVHLSPEQLARAEAWFDRYEDWAVLVGRVTPVVRSFVSIPAGIFRVPFGRYVVLTLIGSAIWCFVFAGIGWAAGASWESVHSAFRYADVVVAVAVVGAVAWLGWRFLRGRQAVGGA